MVSTKFISRLKYPGNSIYSSFNVGRPQSGT